MMIVSYHSSWRRSAGCRRDEPWQRPDLSVTCKGAEAPDVNGVHFMKGFIYNGPGSFELKEIPMETCGDNDVILKNIYAGVCGSDVTAYKSGGDFMRLFPGMEMGHECVSEVVEVGKNVEGIAVGDRVFPYPIFAKDDTKRSGSMGAFSQYIHVPNCKLDHSVYKVDDTISDKVASIIEQIGRAHV